MNQGATEGVGFDVRTGEYMNSDKSISSQQMDGARDVQAGSMLTTEQVYALMRGDVESATPQEEQREQSQIHFLRLRFSRHDAPIVEQRL